MKLFNTLTRKQEEFKPLKSGQISFYHCGPTVYWTQQIGNLRGMTMGDLVVRSFKYLGYEVLHARNYTDVGHLTGDNIGDADLGEDRMEKGAKREGLSPKAIADKYVAQFEKDTQALNLLEPNFKPRATEYIPQMIAMVQTLLDKNFAYTTDLAVYFEVKKFKDYTKLSGQDLSKTIKDAGKGDVSDPQKKDPADFALWFFKAGIHQNALQFWPSPFKSNLTKNGEGFPGWHLECSVMSKTLLGETLDIHLGGVEHISIHHTNEIAQSESANGVKFVNYWLHNEHLVVDNKKMGKSEGNSYVLQDIINKGFEPLALKYFYFGAHYRSKQNFTWEALQGAQAGLKDMKERLSRLKNSSDKDRVKIEKYLNDFKQALNDDLNIPQALAVSWKALKDKNLSEGEKLDLFMNPKYGFDLIFNLNLNQIPKKEPEEIPEQIKKMVVERNQARLNKDFAKADDLRKEIEEAGYFIEDSEVDSLIHKTKGASQ